MRKNKDAYNLAFSQSTKIVAEERKKGEGGIQRTTQEVIDQVEGEFAAHGFPLILPRSTINKYVADGRVGEFPATRGMEGSMPRQCFDVLVLAVESYMQISQVNGVALGTKIMALKINKCCGIESRSKRPIHTLHDRVMKATMVSLNASVCVTWALGREVCLPY